MERRYRITGDGCLCEAALSTAGLAELQELRRKDERFKGCRIFDIIQALPSKVIRGKVYQFSKYAPDQA